MKTNFNHLPSLAKTLVVALTLTSVFSSCKKDKDAPAPEKKASLSIVHAAPGSPELSFFIDKLKANSKALTYTTALDYISVKTGKKEFNVTKKDGTESLVKGNFDLAADKAYSVFVADKTANTLVFLPDDLSAPAADKAKIRFINLSPDVAAVDLAITGKTDALFTKKAFKEYSDFANIEPGAEVNFEIRSNGTTTVLATLPKVKIEKGKIYTIWVKGLKTTTTDDTKLGLSVMTNK